MEEREIVGILEPILQNHNQLVQLFNTVSNKLQNDNYTIVLKADKVPSGQHTGRYNSPTINEVAIVMVGDAFERRGIRIKRRDNTVHTIEDSHRSYDALQYPFIFWEGEDEYHLNIKQRNPAIALDRMMKDLNNNTRLFDGALLLLSGDFRQTLPVIPRATYPDEINACIKQSYLWRNVSALRLNTNIRVQLQNDPLALSFL